MYKKVLYIVGPSSSGKTTIMNILNKRYGYDLIKSTTTRSRRNDTDDVTYNFASIDDFHKRLNAGEFIESANYAGNYYGTAIKDIIKDSDSPLAVKAIEVSGLLKILNSGVHSKHGIEFFVAYIRPVFPEYPSIQKNRCDWEIRADEDRLLFEELRLFFNSSNKELIKRFQIFDNKDSVEYLAATINKWCMFRDSNYNISHGLLRLPSDVGLSKDRNSNVITFIDSVYSKLRCVLYLHCNESFDFIEYFKCKFEPLVSYYNNNYIVIGLDKFGVVAVIKKEV